MPENVIIALISLVGTAVGAGIAVWKAYSLTMYRLEQLEKKMDKHNNFIERLTLVENNIKHLYDYVQKDN
jgi:hypothetical protein